MKKVRIPKSPIAKPKKIAKRGLYELLWCCGKDNYKPRNHGKRLGIK